VGVWLHTSLCVDVWLALGSCHVTFSAVALSTNYLPAYKPRAEYVKQFFLRVYLLGHDAV
jgi:hypothetical protein